MVEIGDWEEEEEEEEERLCLVDFQTESCRDKNPGKVYAAIECYFFFALKSKNHFFFVSATVFLRQRSDAFSP